MKLIYSEDHRGHAGAKEMRYDEMIPMMECPERMDVTMGALMQAGFTDIVAPNPHGLQVVHQVHDPAFVGLLQRCYPLWEAEFGPGRFATASSTTGRTCSSSRCIAVRRTNTPF